MYFNNTVNESERQEYHQISTNVTIAARNIPTDELEAVALAKTELTKPVKVSPAEALKIQRDLDLTDNKMAALRVFHIKHNVDIFPTMKVLRDEKKSTYPQAESTTLKTHTIIC